MRLPDSIRLQLAFANYFEARGIPATCLHVTALRELMLLQLADVSASDRHRRSLLVTFRQNERLYQELTGVDCDDPKVRACLDELGALLARERQMRHKGPQREA